MQENIDGEFAETRVNRDWIDKPAAKEFIFSIRIKSQKSKKTIKIKRPSTRAVNQQG